MTVAEKILQEVRRLPEPLQAEVLDFVEYLQSKASWVRPSSEDEAWQAMSVSQAMRGMESEPSPYPAEDLKGQIERAQPSPSEVAAENAESAERE